MFFDHFILGATAIGLGIVMLKYNYQLVGFTGNIGAVEKYLGYGMTYAFFKIVAVFLCIGGFLYMFGLADPILRWMLSPLAIYFSGPSQ